eukprot:762561-Hanusia_phi.AAC.8
MLSSKEAIRSVIPQQRFGCQLLQHSWRHEVAGLTKPGRWQVRVLVLVDVRDRQLGNDLVKRLHDSFIQRFAVIHENLPLGAHVLADDA